MNELMRDLAPIHAGAWAEIESQAKQVLQLHLAARRVVDFEGPLGWEHSAVNTGRAEAVKGGDKGVETRLRRVQPLLEARVPFSLSRSELDDVARGAADADLEPVVEAAKGAARFEDHAVFHGSKAAGMTGLVEACAAQAIEITDDYLVYPEKVAEALHWLRTSGIDGPYGIALGPRCYTGLHTTFNQGGVPVVELVRRQVDGNVFWAPAVDGAVVLTLRGGDFELTVGRDFSIGYYDHTRDEVNLYLEESFTFRVLDDNAAVPLRYAK